MFILDTVVLCLEAALHSATVTTQPATSQVSRAGNMSWAELCLKQGILKLTWLVPQRARAVSDMANSSAGRCRCSLLELYVTGPAQHDCGCCGAATCAARATCGRQTCALTTPSPACSLGPADAVMHLSETSAAFSSMRGPRCIMPASTLSAKLDQELKTHTCPGPMHCLMPCLH